MQSFFLYARKNLYCCEAFQMLERMKQEAVHLEPALESYQALSYPTTYPIWKPFNYQSFGADTCL